MTTYAIYIVHPSGKKADIYASNVCSHSLGEMVTNAFRYGSRVEVVECYTRPKMADQVDVDYEQAVADLHPEFPGHDEG